jgi:hypothetical protein
MRVRYIGPCCDADGVEIAATGQQVARGATVEVDDELGLSLCDQPDNWAPDGDESVDLFVRFCRFVEAVKAETPPADARALVDGSPLPNPGLAALAAPPATEPAPKAPRSRAAVTESEEG